MRFINNMIFGSKKKTEKQHKAELKEEYGDFILILKQIQEANDLKLDNFLKSRKESQKLIDNIVECSIDKILQKMMELDKANSTN